MKHTKLLSFLFFAGAVTFAIGVIGAALVLHNWHETFMLAAMSLVAALMGLAVRRRGKG